MNHHGSDSCQPDRWHQVLPWAADTEVAMMLVVLLPGSRRPVRGDQQHTQGTHSFPPWSAEAAMQDGGGIALHGGTPFQHN